MFRKKTSNLINMSVIVGKLVIVITVTTALLYMAYKELDVYGLISCQLSSQIKVLNWVKYVIGIHESDA